MAEVLDAFAIGGSPTVVPTATTYTLLRDADPAIFYLLDFLAWGLARSFQTRLLMQLALLPASSININGAVATKLSRDPLPHLSSEQVRFPMLAIHRKKGTHSERTGSRHGESTMCDLLYVLPPMTAAQIESIAPILRTAEVVVTGYMRSLQHGEYTPPGGTLGEDLHEKMGVDFVFPRTTTFGNVANFSTELHMPAIAIEFELREVGNTDETALTALEGITLEVGVHDAATDTDLDAVVVAQTDT